MRVRVPLRFWLPLVVVGLGLAYFVVDWNISGEEVIEYHTPGPKPDEVLVDDHLGEKNPAFIPELIDRRLEAPELLHLESRVDAGLPLHAVFPAASSSEPAKPDRGSGKCRRLRSHVA